MKILILEDNEKKRDKLLQVLEGLESELDVEPVICTAFSGFIAEINRQKFDLVVADLMVPAFHDSPTADDITSRLIEDIRDIGCDNFNTPVIAITQYDKIAEDNYSNLNKYDITVITYDNDSLEWKEPFIRKIRSCLPRQTYEFIIVCALDEEAKAFSEAGFDVGPIFHLYGITCRTLNIGNKKGVIVTPPRMGLVNTAILSARVIDLFEPKLICMGGICAGIQGKVNIYDVVVPDVCHQHDSGKWTNEGFVPELYSIQLQHRTMLKIQEIIETDRFIENIKEGIILKKNEFTDDCETLEFKILTAPTSSGSAVVADEERLEDIKKQHRKMTAFEMESYALYEAARQSLISPMFFSAKCVVDNGDSNKGDKYHRVACLISAKTVYQIIDNGICDT